jgi:hypothetical protein
MRQKSNAPETPFAGTTATFGLMHHGGVQHFDISNWIRQRGEDPKSVKISIVPFDLFEPREDRPRLRHEAGITIESIGVVVLGTPNALLPSVLTRAGVYEGHHTIRERLRRLRLRIIRIDLGRGLKLTIDDVTYSFCYPELFVLPFIVRATEFAFVDAFEPVELFFGRRLGTLAIPDRHPKILVTGALDFAQGVDPNVNQP